MAEEMKPDALVEHDLTGEEWREYVWDGPSPSDPVHRYRIHEPQGLFLRPGGTTHRVLDARGVMHCVPTVGERGCVVQWKPRNPDKPVQF